MRVLICMLAELSSRKKSLMLFGVGVPWERAHVSGQFCMWGSVSLLPDIAAYHVAKLKQA